MAETVNMGEPRPEEMAADRDTGSIWALKPWWCQPWSIVLFGLVVIAASWLLVHRWWITAPLALGILLWWWLFLVLVPRAYRQQEPTHGD